jgi:arsenite-transporting ATPase
LKDNCLLFSFLQVCGVQALQNFSKHFLAPYTPTLKRGSVEELEERVSTLKSSLQIAEAELDRVRKGKQVA